MIYYLLALEREDWLHEMAAAVHPGKYTYVW
jgi:hypothetical protein